MRLIYDRRAWRVHHPTPNILQGPFGEKYQKVPVTLCEHNYYLRLAAKPFFALLSLPLPTTVFFSFGQSSTKKKGSH